MNTYTALGEVGSWRKGEGTTILPSSYSFTLSLHQCATEGTERD